MNSPERNVASHLLETGILVAFRQGETEVLTGPDEAEFMVRIDLTLGPEENDDEMDEDPAELAEWAAFGFLFTLAYLSFADARPRGMSEPDFVEGDELSVSDFVEGLRYERGRLRYSADYLRGRRVKTDVEVRPNGTVELATRGRGKAALRWLDRLKGKKLLEVIESPRVD